MVPDKNLSSINLFAEKTAPWIVEYIQSIQNRKLHHPSLYPLYPFPTRLPFLTPPFQYAWTILILTSPLPLGEHFARNGFP